MRSSLQHILAQDALDPYKIITIEQAACIASVLPLLLLFLIVQKTFARSVETTAWSAEYGKEREQICAFHAEHGWRPACLRFP